MAESITPASLQNMYEVVEAVLNSQSEITIFTSGTTGQPKKVVHSIATLTRAVRIGDRYKGQVWAYAYNPTHMAGLQVFFQAFENQNTLVNVFNMSREYVYEQIREKGRLPISLPHLHSTVCFFRLNSHMRA